MNRKWLVVAPLLGILTGLAGCESNKLRDFYAVRPPTAAPPRVGIAHLFVWYGAETSQEVYAVEGIFGKMTGDDKIGRDNYAMLQMRRDALQVMQEQAARYPGWNFVSAPATDSAGAIPESRKRLAAYAVQRNLDLIIVIETWLELKSDFWVAR